MAIKIIDANNEEELKKKLAELYVSNDPSQLKQIWVNGFKVDLEGKIFSDPNYAATYSGSTYSVATQLINSTNSRSELNTQYAKFVSRDSIPSKSFDLIREAPDDVKPIIGASFKILKNIQNIYEEKVQEFERYKKKVVSLDTTLPGRKPFVGGYHPLTIVMREITDIFQSLGFRVVDGPEIELVKYNFDMLNTPPWHPSRDESDTIYLSNGFVVRTETSPVQIRTMESQKPPVRIISPGRVYRRDRPDATHSPMFHQVEGLYVDEGVTMADLKGTLLTFYRALFGTETKIRFRPHFFPFTEPSAEVDVTCPFCSGKGCRICKHTGWLEMGGSGMVHPNVLEGVGYDSEKITGFAFGLGLDRIAMLRFGIDNIKLLFDSDIRFLRQFSGA